MSEAPASPVPGRLDLTGILLDSTDLSEEQLAAARERQARTGERLTDVLVSEGVVSAEGAVRR